MMEFELKYNQWANGLYLDALEDLSQEEFTRKIASSFPSIRETIMHIYIAEWAWLERWKGNSNHGKFNYEPYQTAQEVSVMGREMDQALINFAKAEEIGDPKRIIPYQNLKGEKFSGPLDLLMRHVVNHSTYHRGQLATLIRQLGKVPPTTDLSLYARLNP